jgi:hypothetical protein
VGTSTRAAGAAEPRPAIAAQGVPNDALPATAWLLALPCAALACALVVLLGPPLSRVLYPAQPPFTLLPNTGARPEPVEGTRYLLSLSAPLLLAAAIVVATRVQLRLSPRLVRGAAVVAQLLAAGVVVWCLVKQREADWRFDFFASWQLLAAVPIAAGVAWAARSGWPAALRPPERRAVRIAAPAVLALATGVWFLSFVQTDQSIWPLADPYNTGFMLDETFAVLNGHTPLVDFTAAYGSVCALALAPLMLLLGKTLLAFTLVMWVLCIVTMLALYGVFRRVTHSSLAALGLALPLMAFAFFAASRDIEKPIAIYQEMPLRNVGPFLIAWLVARRLDRGAGATWPLFAAAGLATLNNVEFGIASLGATTAALLWTAAPLDRRFALRLAGSAAAGLVLSYAGFAVLTLIRAGALPNPSTALDVARIYAVGGVALNPLPHVIGLPFVVFLTYAAAFGVATVRALRGAPNRALTGMLAWSAIFGYGSGAYYMGESVPQGVPTTFLPWSFALALLAIVALRQLRAHAGSRLPSPAALAAVLGLALIATFVLDPPVRIAPWSQISAIRSPHLSPRLTAIREVATPLDAPHDPELVSFVGSTPEPGGHDVLRRGMAVALLWSTGHAVADAYGFVNVVAFAGESVFTTQQLDDTIARLRAAHGAVVLLPELIQPRVAEALSRRGFRVLTTSGYRAGVPGQTLEQTEVVSMHGLTKWVDARALPAGAR